MKSVTFRNTRPLVFFTFFELYKQYQIAQRVTHIWEIFNRIESSENWILFKQQNDHVAL